MSFDEENVGEFTIANISYFSEPGIWLGKILANGVRFAKFSKVSPTKILCRTVCTWYLAMIMLIAYQIK